MWKKEYDILISNFMGVDIIDIRGDMYHISTEGHRIAVEYYENWNWLLPVFIKAKKEIKSVVKNGRINRKAENLVYLCESEILSNNIEKVYEYLARAIELYNKTENINIKSFVEYTNRENDHQDNVNYEKSKVSETTKIIAIEFAIFCDETYLSDNSKNWEDWFEEFLIKFNKN